MKTIGLIGGTSWPSTMLYYQKLNELVQKEKGGHHSCPLILYSIDYDAIKSNYHDGWDKIPNLLKKEIERILTLGIDGLILCNNTLHKGFDIIKSELDLKIPFFHIVELTKDHILKNKFQKILLLGTKFTMEDSFFKQPLADAGIVVVTPKEKERDEIQEIQSQLSKGVLKKEFSDYFLTLSHTYSDCDAIILGCTELPLAFASIKTKQSIINTIELQCEKAAEFVMS